MPVPLSTQPVERVTVRRRVFDQLRDWIEDGTLLPGEQIRDREVAERLGVSRAPVRDAIGMLQQLGAVETVAGLHTRVVEADVNDLALVLAALGALHELAVTTAMPRLTEGDHERMESANAEMENALMSQDAMLARRADDAFHGVFVDRCGSSHLAAAVEPLVHHARRLDGLYFTHVELTEAALDAHRAIIAATRDGDAARAGELTRGDWVHWRGRR